MNKHNILKKWLKEEHITLDDGLPAQPSFVYRKTGEWKGWSDFLGIATTPENTKQDALEDEAFELYKSTLN